MIEFDKNPNYWDKDNVKIEKVKLSFFDGSDQDSIARGFLDGNYTDGRISSTSSVFAELKKGNEDKITYTPQKPQLLSIIFSTWIVQSYKQKLWNSLIRKRQIHAQLYRIKISVRLSTLPLTVMLMQHRQKVKNGADRIFRNTVTPSNFVQVGDKNFGDIVNEKIVNYGKDWANINLNDGKASLLESSKRPKEVC